MAENSIYENGIIYKLNCEDGYYYIGSTTSNPKVRLSNHKQSSKKDITRDVYKHINNIGWDKVKFEIIEKYPCKSKKELCACEDKYIHAAKDKKDIMCLNINRALVTEEEKKRNMKISYEKRKDIISEQHKEYRQKNADKIKEYRTEYNKVNAEARNEYTKKYVEENYEKVVEGRKKYYETNKDKILERCKMYVDANKEKTAEYKKQWVLENKDRLKEENKEYRKANEDKIKEMGKEYYEANREIIREKQKKYNEENKEALRAKHAEYREKLKASPVTECECGGSYKPSGKGKHMRTKTHMSYVEGLEV